MGLNNMRPLYLFYFFYLFCFIKNGFANTYSLSFHSYDKSNEVLRLNIITPTISGNLILQAGEKTLTLKNVQLEDIFVIKANVPCALLQEPTKIYWMALNGSAMSADVPQIKCNKEKRKIKMYVEGGHCIIDTMGNTLWSTAKSLSIQNNMTIYQNIYAIFLFNRHAFKDDNVMKLHKNKLLCPNDNVYRNISESHAKRLFEEAVDFEKKMKK